ncbi:lamin tail domain-containing protein [Candidatus Woesearchaeota archaeon]|nr:lamin tail domain-containing protein [Candidatus Woesearchaeota archaeon]
MSKTKAWIMAALLAVACVSADMVVSQVLYDPIGTESGGEAVELKNTGFEPMDISGWVISTENSQKDAIIPAGTIVQPSGSYLIADTGWSQKKDNADWRLADHEETLTLGNSDSFVALLNGEVVVDRVMWGAPDEVMDGVEGPNVKPGMSLLRVGEEVFESSPDFREGFLIPLTADVTIFVPVIEVSSSVHLNPVGTLTVRNNGDSSLDVKLFLSDLRSGNNTVSKDVLEADSLEFTVDKGSKKDVSIRIKLLVRLAYPTASLRSKLRGIRRGEFIKC